MPQLCLNSPLGALTLTDEDGVLVSVDWGWGMSNEETPLLCEARDQIEAYFDRKLTAFDLPLRPWGTPFRQRVWQAMQAIPYGQTLSYGALAQQLGTSPRAVGGACANNPLPLVIPCHRVVGLANGGLGHYSGPEGPDDLDSKGFLLRLEKAV
jgi:methylated-DNA-[protein]-cysteine S-methyltransferase